MDAQQAQHVTVTISDWLIVTSTLLGPILAVQAQKWIERINEAKRRKKFIFETIMGTRGETLSYDHKRALNEIDLVFAKDKHVINAWHSYFDHLSTPIPDADVSVELKERTNRFTAMLKAMSASVGYDLEDRTIERGYYIPQGHVNLENEQDRIRRGIIAILDGKPLNMNVKEFAVDPDAIAAQIELQKKLASTITATGEMKVQVGPPPSIQASKKGLRRDP